MQSFSSNTRMEETAAETMEGDAVTISLETDTVKLVGKLGSASAARLGKLGVPLFGQGLSSAAVFFASLNVAGVGIAVGDYALAVGIVSLAVTLAFAALRHKAPEKLEQPVPRFGNVQNAFFAGLLCWWCACIPSSEIRRITYRRARSAHLPARAPPAVAPVLRRLPGTTVLTFRGPFTVASNGFFGAWFGLFFAFRLLQLGAPEGGILDKVRTASLSASVTAMLSVCSADVFLASLQHVGLAEGRWGVLCSAISLVVLTACAIFSSRKARRAGSIVLMLLWSAGVGVLTFRAPFLAASNGFFGAWGALLCALAFSFEMSRSPEV